MSMMQKKPLLSLEELQALANAGADVQATPSVFWFYARTLLCIAFVTANVLSMSFYSEQVFGKFDLPDETLEILATYLNSRILIALVGVPLYVIAFVKRRYFVQLSYAFTLLIGVNLVNDWILIYVHVRPESIISVTTMIAMRIVLIMFLILNARFYTRHM